MPHHTLVFSYLPADLGANQLIDIDMDHAWYLGLFPKPGPFDPLRPSATPQPQRRGYTRGGTLVSIRVLDPHGRPLTPVPPKKAVGKVDRGDALWLHIDGVDPDPHHGTIVLTHPVDNPPAPRPLVQLFNADGQLLGWISREVALHYVYRRALRRVGHPPPGEVHAVILPQPAAPEALKKIRRLIARQAAERTLDRHAIRNEILRILSEGGAWTELERAVEALATERLVSPTSASGAVEDLRKFARQVAALDLATASDLAVARTLVLKGRTDGVPGLARPESH